MLELGRRIAEARGRAGLTQAQLASATSIDRVALAKIETGHRRVGATELARIADAVDERFEWFFEEAPAAIVSRRNLVEPGAPERAIDRLVERVTRHVEFVSGCGALILPDVTVFTPPATAADVERAASEVRSLLGLNATEPFTDIQRRFAGVGLLSFVLTAGVDAADAASITLRQGGVTIVNGDLKIGRRRLALVHEFGHHIFADEYSVDFDVARHGDDEQWESRLDRFARAVLLPVRGLTSRWEQLRAQADARTSTLKVASEYRVDMSTLARRLRELELVDAGEAATIRQVRTTKADIVDLDLVVPHELEPPSLPVVYERAVLKLYREDDISVDRALELLFDTWSEDQLPPPELLPEQALWKFV